MIVELIDEAVSNQENNPWEDSPFKNLLKLTIDGRGRIGEEIVSQSLHTTSMNFNEDITDTNNGDKYDLIIEGQKVEVKTAYRDSRNSWQHENIYKNAAVDKIIFIDFDYNNVIITVAPASSIPFEEKNKTFGKKATLRKNKDDGYKLDFSMTTHKNLQKAGLCKIFEPSVNKEDLGEWIQSMM